MAEDQLTAQAAAPAHGGFLRPRARSETPESPVETLRSASARRTVRPISPADDRPAQHTNPALELGGGAPGDLSQGRPTILQRA